MPRLWKLKSLTLHMHGCSRTDLLECSSRLFLGTESVFRAYGIACIFVFVGYVALNFFYIRHLPPIIGAPQPTNELDAETAYLTPHGVPGGGISHSLSNSRLDKATGLISFVLGVRRQYQYLKSRFHDFLFPNSLWAIYNFWIIMTYFPSSSWRVLRVCF